MAFFTPYGIHTEIRLSATPARGPPAALESLAERPCGMACRLSAAWLRRLRPSLAAKPHKGSACAGLSRQQRATLVDHWQAYGLHTRALSALLPPLVASLVNSGLHPRAAGASIGSSSLPRREAPLIFGQIGNRFRSGWRFFRSGGRVIDLVNPHIFLQNFHVLFMQNK